MVLPCAGKLNISNAWMPNERPSDVADLVGHVATGEKIMLSILDPRIWLALLISCALSGGFGYWRGDVAGHKAIQAKWDAAKIVQMEAARAAEATNRATESRLKTQVIEAQNANQDRINKISADAAAARTQSDGLRRDIAAVRSVLPSLAADAVRQYAATATDVLGECADRYTDMAAKAQGHASDSLMYQQAWPK